MTESARYLGDHPADISQPVLPQYRAYQYDPIGNRESVTEAENTGGYTANNLNQYTQQTFPGNGARSFDYNADGNLTSLVENGSETVYTWNAENRLISVAPAAPIEGSIKVNFVYDYIGRRVKKTVFAYSGGIWQLEKEHLFVYDGWNLIEEITVAGGIEISRFFVWGIDLSQFLQGAGGIGGLIASIEGSLTHYYAYDGNGNVGQVINAADGAIAAAYEFDPYGNIIRDYDDHADENPFKFSTKYHDVETGLVYYGYRYFAPEFGRWVSRDPIGEDGGINLYGFVKNDGISLIDYLGNTWYKPWTWFSYTESKAYDGNSKNVTIYVINRGGHNSGVMSGHIDLIIPGCGSGMVGFFGDQTDIADAGTVRRTLQGALWGIDGTINISVADWERSNLEGGRKIYLLPPSNRFLAPEIVNNNKFTGRVFHYTPNLRSWISEIKVCPEQAKEMCEKAKNIKRSPGTFRMAGRNCSTMAKEILTAGGIGSGGIRGIDNPQNLMDQLENAKSYWGYTVYGRYEQNSSIDEVYVLPDPSDKYKVGIAYDYKAVMDPKAAQGFRIIRK